MTQLDTGWGGSGAGWTDSRIPLATSPYGEFHTMADPEFPTGEGPALPSFPVLFCESEVESAHPHHLRQTANVSPPH